MATQDTRSEREKRKDQVKQELLDAALDYMATKAGIEALGIDLDIKSLKKEIDKEKVKEKKEELKNRLKSYIPELKKFRIKGRLYDKITSTPIKDVKVEPFLALGKKVFTNDKGEYEIDVEIPVLPFNNKALVQSKFVYTIKGYIPGYSEVLTQQREVKSDLKTVPLINTKLAAKQAKVEAEDIIYDKIEEIGTLAMSLPDKILVVRRKQIQKLTTVCLSTLLPLGFSLLLVFGITKISDRNKALCPTPTQLKRSIKKRNQIANRINQLYGLVAINVALAVLFTYLAAQLKGIRTQIATLSFPTSVPPGVGVPYSLISALEDVKGLLDKLVQQNKRLNIQLIISLIIFVACLIIISQILKTIDSLIFQCAPETSPLVELNQELQEALDPIDEVEDDTQLVNGFDIVVIEVNKNSVNGLKRRQAVGKNQRGTILVRGDESFSASDKVLKDELAFYIKSNDLKAY